MLCGAKDRHIRCGERWNRRPNAREYKTQTKHERKNLSHMISSFFPKNSNPLFLLFAVHQGGAKEGCYRRSCSRSRSFSCNLLGASFAKISPKVLPPSSGTLFNMLKSLRAVLIVQVD